MARVRVLEFGVGFPPRARVLRTGKPSKEDVEAAALRREAAIAAAADTYERDAILDQEPAPPEGTLYTLNWLPIGGFVKLEGEDGDHADDPRSFARARLPIKLGILIAGVFMNLILSLAIFTGIAWLATPYVGVKFETVQPGSPAAQAGLEGGDAIVTINGIQFDFFGAYDGSTAIEELRALAGQPVTVGVLHADGTTSRSRSPSGPRRRSRPAKAPSASGRDPTASSSCSSATTPAARCPRRSRSAGPRPCAGSA